MRILAIDVGTGTQDIMIYDTEKELENAMKLVLPSPHLFEIPATSLQGFLAVYKGVARFPPQLHEKLRRHRSLHPARRGRLR